MSDRLTKAIEKHRPTHVICLFDGCSKSGVPRFSFYACDEEEFVWEDPPPSFLVDSAWDACEYEYVMRGLGYTQEWDIGMNCEAYWIKVDNSEEE